MAESEEEKTFRFGTGILFVAFFGTLVAGLIAWIENHNTILGIQLIILTILIASLLIWSLYNPFYPFLCGTIIYIGLGTALVIYYPETMVWERRGQGPMSWAFLGFVLLLNATWTGYKELRNKSNSQ